MPLCPTWFLLLALTLTLAPGGRDARQEPARDAAWDEAWDETWAGTWAGLERLRGLAAGTPAEAELRAELARRARTERARPTGADPARAAFRLTLLEAHLAREPGPPREWLLPPTARVAADGAPQTFGPGEAWAAGRALVAGAARSRAFADVLARGAELEPGARLERQNAAFAAFVEDEAAFRGAAAHTIALAMHADARATWSAFCLEGIARRLGRYEEADATLTRHLASVADPAERLDVLQRRAICALGAGWHERASDHLGRALARGGSDAAQMLARQALARDRRDRARAVFRTLLGPDPKSTAASTPWALRGWGLALLPPRGAR